MNQRRRFFILGAAVFLLLAGIGIAALRPSSSPRASSGNKGTGSQPFESLSTRALLAQAERVRIEGSLLEAKQLYVHILQQGATSEVAATAQQRLGEVNLKLLLSPTPTPDSFFYEVQSGDTLSKMARQFKTTVELIKISNGLTSDQIRPGQRLKIVKASFSLIVDKSQNSLTLKESEEVLKVYRCSTGQGGITPVGSFKIINRIVDPPWFTPDGVIPPGDSRNILGSRWLGFDLPGYGIHGTTDPSSIGKPVTQGCVRLTNADAEELFTLLPEGTPVTIVD